MTAIKPYLSVNRLVVLVGEHVAYDQQFHAGLNIIRGSNSSGKSTILDFIFFGLGGDISVWKTAASKCTDVLLEVTINSSVLTLHRKVTDSAKSRMAIFWGPLDESQKFRFKNWNEYPYASRGENESFSKVLFRAFGYPDVKSDQESNLTMHQILRLAYVDQISRTTSLMREEDWDTPLTRETIAHLLFGVYDDTLYADEINRKIRQRELKDVSTQVIHTQDIIDSVDAKLTSEELLLRIGNLNRDLDETNTSIEDILADNVSVRDTSQSEAEALRKVIVKLRVQAAAFDDKIQAAQIDISDSEIFLMNLRSKLQALDESLTTRDSLGNLPACPLCSVQLKEVAGDVKCEFSGKKIQGDFGRSSMLKMREELKFQIAESETLQKTRHEELQKLAEDRASLQLDFETQLRTYRQKTKNLKSPRDNRLDNLYQQKGRLEAELANTTQLGKYLDALANLKRREGQLKGMIAELDSSIALKKRKQQGRLVEAMAEIRSAVFYILARDLKRQDEFSRVESLDLRFDKNTYLLNGRNNFSASSNAVLKNAIHFGILFAAIEDSQFRFPRFILCDNAEDGGMEKERSQNFQHVIAEMATLASQPFQIILSTSMIHPDLDKPEICVGPTYSKENKSLNLPSALQEQAIAPEPVDTAASEQPPESEAEDR